MANDQCSVGASPTTCGGGWSPTLTFPENLTSGEVVTVFFMYLYGNSQAAVLNFSDTLGNAPVLISSQCTNSSPIACTATGYFMVTNPGPDNILVTETGGTTGEMWYNSEIWQQQGQISKRLTAVGSSGYCSVNCTGSVELGPLNGSSAGFFIAASAYVGFYPYTPATWQTSYYYSYSLTDSNPSGGDSILWQGTTLGSPPFNFNATTSPVPYVWAGSAELISWP